MATEAQKRALKRYARKTKLFAIRVNPETEPAIFEALAEAGSVTSYIKGLIRRDIAQRDVSS